MAYTYPNTPPARLHNKLVHPSAGAPVSLVALTVDNAATADATVALFRATSKCMIRKASYHQESNAAAATSFVASLKVGATDLTEDLDIDALGADAGADFVVNDVVVEDGDVVDIVFNETGGTVTAPDLVGLCLEIQLLE